jgi:hypothetical protein
MNLQETLALQGLKAAIENAKTAGCESNGNNCLSCPFRYDGKNGGYDCVLGKMERLTAYIEDNN